MGLLNELLAFLVDLILKYIFVGSSKNYTDLKHAVTMFRAS